MREEPLNAPTMSGRERRRFPRYPIDVPVKVTRTTDRGPQVFLGRGTNMGQGGIQALVATELIDHEHVTVEVTLPYNSQMLKLEAVVCNRFGYNYGLQFLPMGHTEEGQIRRVCGVLGLMFEST
jgi:PilZ domain-containing protein